MENEKKQGSFMRLVLIMLVVALVAFGWHWNKTQQETKAQQEAAMRASQMKPIVVVGEIEEANLSTEKEYVGSVEPIQTVNIVPSITGKIDSVRFKEGSIVRAGQTLFVIEQKQYRATRDLKSAQLAQAKANLDNAASYLKRIKTADSRSISAAELDKANADFLAAQANLASAQASLDLAQLDLDRTSVKSPITGRIGKALFTKGNYVTPQSSPLAVVVQEDPIRVTFAMPDRDYLDIIDRFAAKGSVFKSRIRLSNGAEINLSGERDFENNAVDPKTGTVSVRLRYPNKDGKLIAGSMVRIVTEPVEPRLVKIVPQEAILADAKGDYVFVVTAQSTAEQRYVKLGDEFGNSREVTEGLETGEKVIVQGVLMVRAGSEVQVVEDQKNRSTAAEKAKESDLDIKPEQKTKNQQTGEQAPATQPAK